MTSAARWALVGLVVAVALAVAHPAGAQPAAPGPAVLRQSVNVYLIDLSEFDVATGVFRADMYLTFHCSRECDPHFDFRNGFIESSQLRRDTGTYKEYRVRVQVQEQRVNLRRFPFTKGTLPLELEDDLLDEGQMIFAVEPGSTLDAQVHLPGFELDHDVKATVRSHSLVGGRNYSSIMFEVRYRSHRISVAIKDLLPLALLTFAGLLSFIIDPEDTADRVLVAISALLAVAFFGSTLTGKAPHTDYITLADAYVIGSLLILTFGLAALIYVYDRRRGWRAEQVARVNRRLRDVGLGLWALTQIAFIAVVAA